jgi:glycosyltransferase involved in cell wall biosynthesis
MKVCLLNDSFPPAMDGVVNVVLNYADHLREDHGVEVAVGTPEYPDAHYERYPYPVIPYPSLDTTALTSGYRAGYPFSGKAAEELAAFGPDILHSHCPVASTILGRLLRERVEAPLVFTYHTKFDIDIHRAVKLPVAAEETIRAMVANIEAVDEVWVVSEGAGENLRSLGYTGDCRVMHNGVDFARGRVDEATVERVTAGYDLPAGVPVLLFVGRMMTYKGLPLILDALKLLLDAGQDFRMVFIGKGPDREPMEQKARSLGLATKCIFVGPVYDRDQLRAWNTRADLFLFPSTFDTNGLVVREAAACGLGCVLIKGSCAAEGITDGRNGFLIEESPTAMAELLKKVCPDLPRLHEVGQHAMDEIYLSWQSAVDAAYDRYGAILHLKRSGKLPPKRKVPTDYLMALASRSMEERVRRRRIRLELLNDFRETAQGMMENIQEAQRSAEQRWAKVAEDIQRELEALRRE